VALQAKTLRAGQAGTSLATYSVRLLYAGTMPVVLQVAAPLLNISHSHSHSGTSFSSSLLFLGCPRLCGFGDVH